MSLRIDNQGYAERNELIGRILAPLAALAALASWLTMMVRVAGLEGDRQVRSLVIGTAMHFLFIALMAIVYFRRGRHTPVTWIEIDDERIHVGRKEGEESIAWSDVAGFEYEGLRNRSRADVRRAPFPSDTQRVLVLTLDDGRELRVLVEPGRDAELKRLAESWRSQRESYGPGRL